MIRLKDRNFVKKWLSSRALLDYLIPQMALLFAQTCDAHSTNQSSIPPLQAADLYQMLPG